MLLGKEGMSWQDYLPPCSQLVLGLSHVIYECFSCFKTVRGSLSSKLCLYLQERYHKLLISFRYGLIWVYSEASCTFSS